MIAGITRNVFFKKFEKLKQRGKRMFIRVIYNTGKHSEVKPFQLDKLISSGRIIKFLRSDGWVTLGTDSIRGIGGIYTGPDRREPSTIKLL